MEAMTPAAIDRKRFQAQVNDARLRGHAFLQLAVNISQRFPVPKFDRDDLVQAAVVRCLLKLGKWNPRRADAFTFFTTVTFNAMRTHLRDQGRHHRRVEMSIG
jgi:DNA-directed RNA polymerase specialized sigma24 family protein